MKTFKLFSLLLTLLLTMLLFAACGDSTPETVYIPLMQNGVSDYTVVYPLSYTGNNIKGEAMEVFREAMKTNGGNAMEIRSDFLIGEEAPSEKEILLGVTNRPESEKALKTLRRDDYLIGFVDGKLVVIGGSDEANARAIRHFTAMFFKEEQKNLVLADSFSKRFDGNYPLSSLTLADHAIGDYAILTDTAAERDALALQNGILSLTGYTLPIVKNAETATLLTVKSGAATEALGDLSDADAITRSEKVTAFLEALKGRSGDVMIASSEELSLTRTDKIAFSLLDLNVFSSGYAENGVDERYLRLMTYLSKLRYPDILTLQDVSPTWIDQFSKSGEGFEAMNDVYLHVGKGRNNDNDSVKQAIFYKKDRFTKVKEGTLWLSETPTVASVGWDGRTRSTLTWLILKDNQSGEEFAVMTARLDPFGSKARQNAVKLIIEKAEELALPVIFAGDLQSEAKDKPAKSLAEYVFTDAQSIALEGDKTLTSTVNKAFGDETYFKTKSDFVFTSYGDFTVRSHKIDAAAKVDDRFVSCHNPIYTELTLIRYE